MTQRARLTKDVFDDHVQYSKGTYGWVKVVRGYFYFSETEDFRIFIAVNGDEFKYV